MGVFRRLDIRVSLDPDADNPTQRALTYDSLTAFIADREVLMEVDMSSTAQRQQSPTPRDAAIARSSGQVLARYARTRRPLPLRFRDHKEENPIELPAGAVKLLIHVLEAMAEGRGVTVIPEGAELTTVQAAEVLNVSRPFLIKLLDENAIPHRRVGKHRRVRSEDVMAYKEAIDREREQVLDQLTREAQEQDLGYRVP